MPAITDLSGMNLFYRVFHPEFDPKRVYRALAYIAFAETAWSQLLFINEQGMTYAVTVYKTRCIVDLGTGLFRDATVTEAALEPAKPKGRNVCIDEVDG